MSDNSSRSVEQIQAEIEAARARLAGTIDELTFRAQPQEIVRRQTESARASFFAATHDERGDLRTERIAAVLGAVAAVLIGMGLLRRRRS
jgi:hypothetical protein